MRRRALALALLGTAFLTPALAAGPVASERATGDRPDDGTGYQIHAVYAVPSDLSDRHYDTDGSIAYSLTAIDTWFYKQTGQRQRLNLDRVGGAIDITFVRLAQTDAQLRTAGIHQRDRLEDILKQRGFRSPRKLYAVYYDGTHATTCADGAYPPSLPGTVAAAYLRAQPPGWTPCDTYPWAGDGQAPAYRDFTMLHEIVHTLGFTPATAAHHTRQGHTSISPTDLMYAGDEPWRTAVLDAAGEIYNHGRPGELDLARSAFLTPTVRGAAPPPQWNWAVSR